MCASTVQENQNVLSKFVLNIFSNNFFLRIFGVSIRYETYTNIAKTNAIRELQGHSGTIDRMRAIVENQQQFTENAFDSGYLEQKLQSVEVARTSKNLYAGVASSGYGVINKNASSCGYGVCSNKTSRRGARPKVVRGASKSGYAIKEEDEDDEGESSSG